MVRYACGGGEICMMALRIARAHTQRDRVAICGYHGTWDWYLACNLDGDEGAPPKRKDRLGKHWLADVAPTGVPSQLEGTTLDWNYGDVEHLVMGAAQPDTGRHISARRDPKRRAPSSGPVPPIEQWQLNAANGSGATTVRGSVVATVDSGQWSPPRSNC